MAQLTGAQEGLFEAPRYANEGAQKFTTTGQDLNVTSLNAAVFQGNAALAARVLVAGPLVTAGCVPEDSATHSACRGLLIARASAAYRRPLSEADVASLDLLLRQGTSKFGFKEALTLTLEAVLQSPQFLYRSEIGDKAEAGLATLTDYEIASALAYDLTDAPPDAPLLDDAQQRNLRDPDVRGAHARRLLRTPAAKRKFRQFFFRWLSLTKPVAMASKPSGFDRVVHSMELETNAFLDRHLWDDTANLNTLFTSTVTWVDTALASHYGIEPSGIADEGLWTTIPERKGILANGRVMVAHPNERGRLAIRRGLMVMENLQCENLPVPPVDVSIRLTPIESAPPDATAREVAEAFFAANADNPCANCHGFITDLSLAFENFDELGRHRSQESGKPIDAHYTDEQLGTFANGFDYVQALMQQREGQECVIRHLASFAVGVEDRSEPNEAACIAERLWPRWAERGLQFTDLLVQMVQDDTFIKRRFIP